ncbi:OmpH family outer membrane protein [Pigmentibacter ruber]|uniref:OmpH family outer membrane protein n=1 Tax=Pigmentibacter ruber TaxID=2683196 RepID=UPI00131AC6C2|nr:OmpH family outer membrane protein [Pigmentibacter ruber]BFD30854.1 hypothetical protein GTC16762_04720 [Pigmentibacter ruber]
MVIKFKNILVLVTTTLLMQSLSSQASMANESKAAASSAAGKLKICVVNVQAAILKTNEGEAARQKIQVDIDKDREALRVKQNELKGLEEKYKAQEAVLGAEDKDKLQKQFQGKLQEYQKAQMNFEQNARQKEIAATQEIYQKLINIVRDTRKAENCTLAFDSGAGVLLDADEVKDITQKTIEKYNAVHKTKEAKDKKEAKK